MPAVKVLVQRVSDGRMTSQGVFYVIQTHRDFKDLCSVDSIIQMLGLVNHVEIQAIFIHVPI